MIDFQKYFFILMLTLSSLYGMKHGKSHDVIEPIQITYIDINALYGEPFYHKNEQELTITTHDPVVPNPQCTDQIGAGFDNNHQRDTTFYNYQDKSVCTEQEKLDEKIAYTEKSSPQIIASDYAYNSNQVSQKMEREKGIVRICGKAYALPGDSITDAVQQLSNLLKSPKYKHKLEQALKDREGIANNTLLCMKFGKDCLNKQHDFIKMVLNGELVKRLSEIEKSCYENAWGNPHYPLEDLWPWIGRKTFLLPSNNAHENDFIQLIEIDIMQAVEMHVAASEAKNNVNHYYTMHMVGDKNALVCARDNLIRLLSISPYERARGNCPELAIVTRLLKDPLTDTLYTIAHDSQVERAKNVLEGLEISMLNNYANSPLRATMGLVAYTENQKGFDVLRAAHACYQRRLDYPQHSESNADLPYSNKLILFNIAHLPLEKSFRQLKCVEKEFLTRYNGGQDVFVEEYGGDFLNCARETIAMRSDYQSWQQEIRDQQTEELQSLVSEYKETQDMYRKEGIGDHERFAVRIAAINDLTQGNNIPSSFSYDLTDRAAVALKKIGLNPLDYTRCYGSPLQHIVHAECLKLLECMVLIPDTSLLRDYTPHLVEFVDAAREYNQNGYTVQAMTIADFCWTFIDYGEAFIEGLGQGLINTAKDIYHHPIEMAAMVVAGRGVVVYNLSKVLTQVARVTWDVSAIGVEYLNDPNTAIEKWNSYIEPLCKALKESDLSARNIIKQTTCFAVQWKAQGKLLHCLHGLFDTAKGKIAEWIVHNPFKGAEDVIATTPEGIIIRVSTETPDDFMLFKKSTKNFSGSSEKIGKDAQGTLKAERKAIELSGGIKITTKQAVELAESLGFRKTNYRVHQQPVFQRGNFYITIDVDSHCGGVWKMADSVKNLSSKKNRMGTYDKFLNRIGD